MSIGENIKKLMEEQGYTVRSFAKQIGISSSYLSDIRQDRQDPSLKILRKVAKKLNVKTETLLKEYREHQEKIEKNTFSQEELNLIKKYRELPGDKKSYIQGQIQTAYDMSRNEQAEKRGAS